MEFNRRFEYGIDCYVGENVISPFALAIDLATATEIVGAYKKLYPEIDVTLFKLPKSFNYSVREETKQIVVIE